MGRRATIVAALTVASVALGGPAARACGFLVAANGAVGLAKATTLAAYQDGVEHYVTSFEFAGLGSETFGSIVPLPGVPTKVERGGDWTLQRLVREVRPPRALERAASGGVAAAADVRVHLRTRIDGLDITVLEGGGDDVARWARANGFTLSADAPEALRFYARRSPVFMAARFDASAAVDRGLRTGDGIPIHLTIPTENPWVPLRILALAKGAEARVEADVFLLTERRPSLLPVPENEASGGVPVAAGLFLERSEPASARLLADLASDEGMGWLATSGMWLTSLRMDAAAGDVRYDLAVDASGAGRPSPVAAGLAGPIALPLSPLPAGVAWGWAEWLALAALLALLASRTGPIRPRAWRRSRAASRGA